MPNNHVGPGNICTIKRSMVKLLKIFCLGKTGIQCQLDIRTRTHLLVILTKKSQAFLSPSLPPTIHSMSTHLGQGITISFSATNKLP